MKIVNVLGGLGNQMFEYAMYLALKDAHPEEEIYLCTRSYNGYPLHNGYELKRIFGIEGPEATLSQLLKVAYPIFNYKTWQFMHHILPQRKSMALGTENIPFNFHEVTRNGDVFYDGYWQNENNFISIRDKIIKAFSFSEFEDERNLALACTVLKKRAVSCHIRRGDYLKDPIMCVCNTLYYEKAFAKVEDLVSPEMYVIFSDDIQWCRKNITSFIEDKDIVFVDWNNGVDSYRDMQLMSLCNYNIIANSSFSWWGGWLNQHFDKIVISPEKWMNKPIVNSPICKSWIRISNA